MKLIPIVLATLGICSLAACDKRANATKQDVIVTDLPASPQIGNDVFALKDGKQSVEYKSTLFVINPAGDPALLAEVIRTSELSRVKAAALEAYIGGDAKAFEAIWGLDGKVSKDIRAKKEDLKAFMAVALPRAGEVPLDDRQTATVNWFEPQVAALGLNETDSKKLHDTFAAYCDAKVLELAVHPEFARLIKTGVYTQRPTPMQFCEPYYATKGYFTADICKTDYFACLWTDGVVKSSTNSQTVANLIKPVFDDAQKTEELRALLASNQESTPYLTGVVATGTIGKRIYNTRNYFYNGILSTKTWVGNNCKTYVKASFAFLCGDLIDAWRPGTNAQAIIGKVETSQELVVAKDNVELNIISDAVIYFGKRPMDVAPGEKDSTPFPSNSDYYFHALAPPAKLNHVSDKALGMNDRISAVFDLFLDKVFRLSDEDRAIKTQKEADISALEKDLAERSTTQQRLTNEYGDAVQAAVAATNAGNVGFGLIDFVLTVSHTEDIMRAKIVFQTNDESKQHAFLGCYDKNKLQGIICPDGIDPASTKQIVHPATLQLNPAKGRIDFSLLVDDPVPQGLGPKAKVTEKDKVLDYFMLLQPEQIKGTTLAFEFYPNRLEKTLDILTGKALFRDGATDRFEGGLSMWEQH